MLIVLPAEYQPAENERGRVVRYKFAFQWCEAQVRNPSGHSTITSKTEIFE